MLTNKIVNQHFLCIILDIQKKEFKPKFKLFFYVIPAGFEPTTHSLEGCCSIQLSYETISIQLLMCSY